MLRGAHEGFANLGKMAVFGGEAKAVRIIAAWNSAARSSSKGLS
jgi:hypothetical protein